MNEETLNEFMQGLVIFSLKKPTKEGFLTLLSMCKALITEVYRLKKEIKEIDKGEGTQTTPIQAVLPLLRQKGGAEKGC